MNNVAKKALVGCSSILLLSVIVIIMVGFIGYRRLYPSPPSDKFPQQVGKYTRTNLYSRGGLWGEFANHPRHVSEYILSDNSGKTVEYELIVYASPEEAQAALLKENGIYAPDPFGGTIVGRGVVKNKDGQEIGTRVVKQSVATGTSTGGVSDTIVSTNGSLVIVLRDTYYKREETSLADLEEFERDLPFNQGASFTAETAEVSSNPIPTQSPTEPVPRNGPVEVTSDEPPPPVVPTPKPVPKTISGGVLNGKVFN